MTDSYVCEQRTPSAGFRRKLEKAVAYCLTIRRSFKKLKKMLLNFYVAFMCTAVFFNGLSLKPAE